MISDQNKVKELINACILHYKLVLFDVEPWEKSSKTYEKTDFKVDKTINKNS